MEGIDFPMAPDDKNVDATIAKDCQGLTDVELFARDTLDSTQGNHLLSICFLLWSTVISPACALKNRQLITVFLFVHVMIATTYMQIQLRILLQLSKIEVPWMWPLLMGC